MNEISTPKKLEVAQYYLLGYTYDDIQAETGISHGSVANTVRELESGRLNIPGTAPEQVNDLRQLALDLKKKGLQSSQALLGLVVFERYRDLGITPELVDRWAELAKRFAPADSPAADFLEVALRLHELEASTGTSFETLAEEHKKLQESAERLKKELDSLRKRKSDLVCVLDPLGKQTEALKQAKQRLENEVQMQSEKTREVKSRIGEIEAEKVQLDKEVKNLQTKKIGLSSAIDKKEESLSRINDIGLSDEDLVRLRTFLERMSQTGKINQGQIRERFFSALDLFKEIGDLEKARDMRKKKVEELTAGKNVLSGQINELSKTKSVLEGEVDALAQSICQRMRDIGQDATLQIQQEVADIREQLAALFEDTLKAGEAVGQMSEMVRSGEDSQKSLEEVLDDIQNRLVKR